MFSQLPKLFDRDFAVGYFLPVVAFVAASYGFLSNYGAWSYLFPVPTINNALVYGSIIVVISWFMAVLLLAANRPIYRLKEGYWINYTAYSRLNFIQRWRYKRLIDKKNKLRAEIGRKKAELGHQQESEELDKLIRQADRLLEREAEEFPEKSLLLPTRFGNVMRSFETYSSQIYGFEDIQGWSRLLAVIPKDYRAMIDSAKAEADFWINLWFVSALLVIEYIVVVLYDATYWGEQQTILYLLWSPLLVYPVAAVALAFFASWGARVAAISWGDYVKASYDIYLLELGRKLGFPSATREQQRILWKLFSRVTIFRLPQHVNEYLKQSLIEASTDSAANNRFGMVQDLAKQLIASKSELAELRSQLELSKSEIIELKSQLESSRDKESKT